MKIAIFGAGSIGCYVGGCLIASGLEVTLIGRERVRSRIAASGLRLSDLEGGDLSLPADRIRFSLDAAAAAACDSVLITVKSAQTPDAANALRPHLRAGTRVVSLQNGVRNPGLLRELLPEAQVIAGMVPFNVAELRDGHFHRGTGGRLLLQQAPASAHLAFLLLRSGIDAATHPDLDGVLWGKLLLNLNNPINALSGLPLRDQLSRRGYRRVLARSIREGLQVLRAAGRRPVGTVRAPLALLPTILSLPDGLFRRLAGALLAIDPQARSSMQDDLRLGRNTEIDFITGEVVQLARRHGIATPVSSRIIELIRLAEAEKSGAPGLAPEALLC